MRAPPLLHFFSRTTARRYGVREAIVLRFLSYKVSRSKNFRDGRRWHYDSIDALAVRYPYIPRSTLWDVVRRLERAGAIETARHNRRKADLTTWYHVPEWASEIYSNELIGLDVQVATDLSICAGVLVQNLRYWSNSQKTEWHHMSPRGLMKSLPFSESSIKRALHDLVTLGVIAKSDDRVAHYRLNQQEPKADEGVRDGHLAAKSGSMPDGNGSPADDVTRSKPFLIVPLAEDGATASHACPYPATASV